MWSVKCTPNPGLARISASLASSTGCSLRVVLISMDIKLPPFDSSVCRQAFSGPAPQTNRLEAGGDRVADLGRTTDRPGYPLGHVGDRRCLHRRGGLGVPEVVEQQRGGEDRGGRVGLLLARDVGRR